MTFIISPKILKNIPIKNFNLRYTKTFRTSLAKQKLHFLGKFSQNLTEILLFF